MVFRTTKIAAILLYDAVSRLLARGMEGTIKKVEVRYVAADDPLKTIMVSSQYDEQSSSDFLTLFQQVSTFGDFKELISKIDKKVTCNFRELEFFFDSTKEYSEVITDVWFVDGRTERQTYVWSRFDSEKNAILLDIIDDLSDVSAEKINLFKSFERMYKRHQGDLSKRWGYYCDDSGKTIYRPPSITTSSQGIIGSNEPSLEMNVETDEQIGVVRTDNGPTLTVKRNLSFELYIGSELIDDSTIKNRQFLDIMDLLCFLVTAFFKGGNDIMGMTVTKFCDSFMNDLGFTVAGSTGRGKKYFLLHQPDFVVRLDHRIIDDKVVNMIFLSNSKNIPALKTYHFMNVLTLLSESETYSSLISKAVTGWTSFFNSTTHLGVDRLNPVGIVSNHDELVSQSNDTLIMLLLGFGSNYTVLAKWIQIAKQLSIVNSDDPFFYITILLLNIRYYMVVVDGDDNLASQYKYTDIANKKLKTVIKNPVFSRLVNKDIVPIAELSATSQNFLLLPVMVYTSTGSSSYMACSIVFGETKANFVSDLESLKGNSDILGCSLSYGNSVIVLDDTVVSTTVVDDYKTLKKFFMFSNGYINVGVSDGESNSLLESNLVVLNDNYSLPCNSFIAGESVINSLYLQLGSTYLSRYLDTNEVLPVVVSSATNYQSELPHGYRSVITEDIEITRSSIQGIGSVSPDDTTWVSPFSRLSYHKSSVSRSTSSEQAKTQDQLSKPSEVRGLQPITWSDHY